MNSLVCLVVLSSFMFVSLDAVEHNRMIGDLRVKFVLGEMQEYCRETDSDPTVEWGINEKHTISCFECECSVANRGILCKGLGYEDGAAIPENCIKRRLQDFEMQPTEKCCYQMVNKDNQAVVCGEKVCA